MIPPRFWFLTAMAMLAAATRLIPHPMNFTAMGAVALFGAATFSRRSTGVVVAFGSLLASDALLHLTYQAGWQPHWGFYQGQWVVYACLVPTLLLGFAIRGRRCFATVASATLASSVTFFLLTNFAVWAGGSAEVYPKTAQGLMLCYQAAIPFFRNGLAADVVFSTVLFGGLAIAESRFAAIRASKTAPSPDAWATA